MYLDHFGLNRPPFKITPDPSLFYEGSQRGAALGALIFAIQNGEGIIKVVGEVGSGKTMLCRMLEVKISGQIDIIYIANPSQTPDTILHVIANELGLEVSNDTSKIDVMQKLQDYLLKKHADNRQVVMFIEEAQSMPVETLEEIRLLSNLETDQNKLLQMVLFGQPELDEKLSLNHIRQLKERITHSFYLEPFPPKDTHEYLNFRMRSVGYKGPDIFNRRTASAIKKYSNGLTRRINILADKSLMATFSEGKHEVATKHVKTAAKDSDFHKIGNNKKLIIPGLVVVGMLVAVWIGTLIPGSLQDNKKPSDSIPKSQTLPAQTTESEAEAGSVVTNSQQIKNPAPVESPVATQLIEQNTQKAPVDEGKPMRVASSSPVSDVALDGQSLLENRLQKTAEWLSTANDKHYSIQLFLTRVGAVKALEEFLANVPEGVDFNNIYIYETLINGKYMYSVNYGSYASYRFTVKTLDSIADNFQSKPFVRPVSALRYGFDAMQKQKLEAHKTAE